MYSFHGKRNYVWNLLIRFTKKITSVSKKCIDHVMYVLLCSAESEILFSQVTVKQDFVKKAEN